MIKNSKSAAAGKIVANLIFILLSLSCLLPIILIISVSLSDNGEILKNGYSFLPQGFNLEAYRYLMKDSSKLVNAYKITIIATGFEKKDEDAVKTVRPAVKTEEIKRPASTEKPAVKEPVNEPAPVKEEKAEEPAAPSPIPEAVNDYADPVPADRTVRNDNGGEVSDDDYEELMNMLRRGRRRDDFRNRR